MYSSLQATYGCGSDAITTLGSAFVKKTIGYSSRFLAYGTLSSPNQQCNQNVVVGGFHTIDFSSLYYNPIITSTTTKAGCPPYVNPRLSLPAELTDVDPAWATCQPLFYGAFDPPRVLSKDNGPLGPPPQVNKPAPAPAPAHDPVITKTQEVVPVAATQAPAPPVIPAPTPAAPGKAPESAQGPVKQASSTPVDGTPEPAPEPPVGVSNPHLPGGDKGAPTQSQPSVGSHGKDLGPATPGNLPAEKPAPVPAGPSANNENRPTTPQPPTQDNQIPANQGLPSNSEPQLGLPGEQAPPAIPVNPPNSPAGVPAVASPQAPSSPRIVPVVAVPGLAPQGPQGAGRIVTLPNDTPLQVPSAPGGQTPPANANPGGEGGGTIADGSQQDSTNSPVKGGALDAPSGPMIVALAPAAPEVSLGVAGNEGQPLGVGNPSPSSGTQSGGGGSAPQGLANPIILGLSGAPPPAEQPQNGQGDDQSPSGDTPPPLQGPPRLAVLETPTALAVGTHSVDIASNGGIVVAGQTIASGQQGTIDNTPIKVDASNNVIIAGTPHAFASAPAADQPSVLNTFFAETTQALTLAAGASSAISGTLTTNTATTAVVIPYETQIPITTTATPQQAQQIFELNGQLVTSTSGVYVVSEIPKLSSGGTAVTIGLVDAQNGETTATTVVTVPSSLAGAFVPSPPTTTGQFRYPNGNETRYANGTGVNSGGTVIGSVTASVVRGGGGGPSGAVITGPPITGKASTILRVTKIQRVMSGLGVFLFLLRFFPDLL